MRTDITIISFVATKRTPMSVIDLDKLKFARVRGGSVLKGTVELLKDFSNDVEIEAIIYQFQGNEFRLTPFKMAKSKFCDLLERDKIGAPGVMKDFNVPYECPIKAGNYTGQYTLDLRIPPTFNGRYRSLVNYYHMSEKSDTFNFTFEIQHYSYAV